MICSKRKSSIPAPPYFSSAQVHSRPAAPAGIGLAVDHPGFAPALGVGADFGAHEVAHRVTELLVLWLENNAAQGFSLFGI
jgi:hypothetical protein